MMEDELELSINSSDAEEVRQHYEKRGRRDLPELLKKKRNEWIDVPIHVGISGSIGVGTSSFINAVRNIKDDHKIGAELNVTQTTIEPIPYSHPNKHYLKFWDLPQIGSRAFTKDLYLKNINFKRYDYFLIFTNNHFTADDLWFANQILTADKKCYFVRTCLDLDIERAQKENAKSDPISVQKQVITAIREDLVKSLKIANFKPDQVYLITNNDVTKYDFPKLAHRMIVDLSDRKWEAMAMTLQIFAAEVIHEKRRALQKRVWLTALLSGMEDLQHVYGLQYDINLELLIAEVQEYRRQFCLDEVSLLRMARSIDTSLENLKKASKFKTNYSQLADGGLLSLYKTWSVFDVTEGITQSFTPILGNLITGNAAFGATYFVMNKLLDMMETDALRLIEFVKYRRGEAT